MIKNRKMIQNNRNKLNRKKLTKNASRKTKKKTNKKSNKIMSEQNLTNLKLNQIR